MAALKSALKQGQDLFSREWRVARAIDPRASAGAAKVPSAEPETRWRVVLLCALVCLLDGYDMVVAPVSAPAMAIDWGLAPSMFTSALTAGILGIGLGSAFIAPLGDRFGRRPLVMWSFALVGTASLATSFCTDVTQLTLLRFITGIGMGASLANALALTSEYAAPRVRSRVLACVYASSAFGGALGGLIAPSILAVAGWRGIYGVGGILPLLLVPLLWFWLAESQRFLCAQNQSDSTAGDNGAEATDAGKPPGGLLDSLLLLLAPRYRRATGLVWLLFFLCTFTIYMISSWLPTLMHLMEWSLDSAIRALMVFSFGGILGGFFLSWMVDIGRIRSALLLGFGLTATALGGLQVAPANFAVWMTLISMMGAGIIGAANALTAVAVIVYPIELRASGIGAAGAVGRLGATAAPVIGGALLALDISALGILSGLILPMFAGLIVVLCFYRLLNSPTEYSLP